MFSPLARLRILLLAYVTLAGAASAAQMEVLTIESKVLRGNPLGDPERRRLAVVVPDGAAKGDGLPLVLYLPGWGGSSEDTIASARGGWIGLAVDALATKGMPVRVAVVDARSRYGGSQYVNSAATGRYADFITQEVLALLKEKYGAPAKTLVAGHSSGGYGAVMLAMRQHELFSAVVGLSPDSDFEVTHKPLVEDAAVRHASFADLAAAMAPAGRAHVPNGLPGLVMGLCANYTPHEGASGQFDWLYDAHGNWQPAVWARWIAADPLTFVREHPDAFTPAQRIYLDGAEHDEFGANIGARKIAVVLKARSAQVEFYESPGHHGDGLPDRLAKGLAWVLRK